MANPVPMIGSVIPANGLTANAATQASAQTLTINGSNFISSSGVLWNGTALTGVTYVSASQLTVPVPASDLQSSGTATVAVSNPAPGGGSSNAVVLNINPPTPASPTLSLASANALSGGFELIVSAANVLDNSVVVWDCGNATCNNASAVVLNSALTTPPSSTGSIGALTAVVPNSLIATAGSVPIAVASPNADGSFTTAVSGTTNFTIGAANVPACLLAGSGAGAPNYRNYAFVATGADVNGAASMAGSFRIDATGAVVNTALPNIVNSFTDFKDPASLFAAVNNNGRMTGGKGSCADNAAVPGTGIVTFTVAGIANNTFTLKYTLRQNGNGGRITLADTAFGLQATGRIQLQFSPTAFSLGSFAFGLLGRNAANSRYAVIGALCTSSPPFLQADFDDTGTPSTGIASGWSLNPGDATTGRTTTTALPFNNGRSMTLTIYGVGGGEAYAMESSPVATSKQVLSGAITGFKGLACLPTGTGGSFTKSSLGTAVFGLSSESTSSVTLGVVAPSGAGRCPAGPANGTINADVNNAGVARTLTGATVRTCYSVAASGRVSLELINSMNLTSAYAFAYLDGAGNGYAIGASSDIPFGFIQSQAAPPLPAIGGTHGFAPFNFYYPAAPLPVTSVAIDGMAGTIVDNAVGGSMTTAPYSFDTTTGRGTAMLSNGTTFGDTSVVFYEATGRQLYIMDQAAAAPVIGALIQ